MNDQERTSSRDLSPWVTVVSVVIALLVGLGGGASLIQIHSTAEKVKKVEKNQDALHATDKTIADEIEKLKVKTAALEKGLRQIDQGAGQRLKAAENRLLALEKALQKPKKKEKPSE